MNGRLESELNKQKIIKAKLKKLPPIFTEFYSYMEEDDRSQSRCDWLTKQIKQSNYSEPHS